MVEAGEHIAVVGAFAGAEPVSRLALFKHFWAYDLKLVARDRFLVFVPSYLVVIVVAMRFGVPPLTGWLKRRFDFDLEPYWPLIGSYTTVLLSSMFLGLLIGFLMLDEKEQGTLRARLVTPVALSDYLMYRIGLPGLFAFVALPAIAVGHGLGAPSIGICGLLALANAPMASAAAIFFPLMTRDKVQAFAWGKLLSGLCFLPMVAALLDAPWKFVVGAWVPPFWTVEAYVRAANGQSWWAWALIGALTSWAFTAWTVHLYQRSVRKSV